jgi:hypothetical protein
LLGIIVPKVWRRSWKRTSRSFAASRASLKRATSRDLPKRFSRRWVGKDKIVVALPVALLEPVSSSPARTERLEHGRGAGLEHRG